MFVTRQPGSNSDGPLVQSHVLGIVNILIIAHSIRLGEQLPLEEIIGHPVSTSYSYEIHMKNVNMPICYYTGCNRRNGPDFGRAFLMLNYTEKPQNTYIQS